MDRTSTALAACLHQSPSAAHADLLASLTGDEWVALVALAARNGVASHLLGRTDLPAPAATRLRERTVAAARRTLRYRAEFLNLAAALEPLGVDVMALKGIHLAQAVYPASVTREMVDIDILVRPSQIDLVTAAARRLGFQDDTHALARVEHHVPAMRKPGVMLEIHWRLAGEGAPPEAEPGDLWARARPRAAAQSRAQVAGWRIAYCPGSPPPSTSRQNPALHQRCTTASASSAPVRLTPGPAMRAAPAINTAG